jgi:predicted dehydrogenase
VGEAIVNKTEPRINVEHALHVLEIIEAARKSSATGQRIMLKSSFTWPMV